MYDAVFVLVEAFNKILRKKPDQFRSYTTLRRNGALPGATNGNGGATNMSTAGSQANSQYGNGSIARVLDCNTAKGWVTPWEHGDKISRYLRKVRTACLIIIIIMSVNTYPAKVYVEFWGRIYSVARIN